MEDTPNAILNDLFPAIRVIYPSVGKRAQELLSNDGVISVGVHVGNSDIVGEFVYEDSEQIVELISRVKQLNEVEKIVWSEEMYLLDGREERILPVLNRIIDRQ